MMNIRSCGQRIWPDAADLRRITGVADMIPQHPQSEFDGLGEAIDVGRPPAVFFRHRRPDPAELDFARTSQIDGDGAAVVAAPPGIPEPSVGKVARVDKLESGAEMPAISVADDLVGLRRRASTALHRAQEAPHRSYAKAGRDLIFHQRLDVTVTAEGIAALRKPPQTFR